MLLSTQVIEHRQRALILKRTLGTRTAAGFLRNRGIALHEALFILCGRVWP